MKNEKQNFFFNYFYLKIIINSFELFFLKLRKLLFAARRVGHFQHIESNRLAEWSAFTNCNNITWFDVSLKQKCLK